MHRACGGPMLLKLSIFQHFYLSVTCLSKSWVFHGEVLLLSCQFGISCGESPTPIYKPQANILVSHETRHTKS